MNGAQIQEPLQYFRQLIDRGAAALPGRGKDWLDAQRALALKSFMMQGFPTRSDENWRYTSLDRLFDISWTLRNTTDDRQEIDLNDLWHLDDAIARLVFVNGRWAPDLSDLRSVTTDLHIGGLRAALVETPEPLAGWLGQAIPHREGSKDLATETSTSPFTALNTVLFDDGAWIRIPAGVQLSGPIELLYLNTEPSTAHDPTQDQAPVFVQPRNLIVLEDGAKATLVEHYAGPASATYFTNALTEVYLGRNASLEHARLQDESVFARHLSNVFVRQGKNSRYEGFNLSLGALWSRTEFHNAMTEENAHCLLNGLYIAGEHQLTDVHLDIDHAVPNCTSRERFKGILVGRGRAVFDGRIRVQVDAQKTDAQLSNDNLLLSREAEVDTKPQLEIYADDVKCSHGTTIGQLEPAQLFYLRTRGIDSAAAQRMMCMGFATEIMENCTVTGLRERVEHRLAGYLNDSRESTSH